MRRLSVSASNLGQLDDACAHVGSSARKETKTETKPDPKMLSGSARGDHQRLFQQHRPKADIGTSPQQALPEWYSFTLSWLGWTHEAARISRCARRCGGYTGRMYHCIERCGRKGVRKGAVGAHHVVRGSVFNLCRTIGLQKRAGTIACCRHKCGPHLPRSDESWTDIGTSSQGSSTH